MPDITQSISIKADITGLEKLRQGKSDIENLKKASEELGEVSGVKADVQQISGMQKQINYMRLMQQISNKMMQDMKANDFVGTKSYVKNLEKSVKHMNKMSNILDNMGDEQDDQNRGSEQERTMQKTSMGAIGGIAMATSQAVAGGDIMGVGVGGMRATGNVMQQIGAQRGGRVGEYLQGAGKAGIIMSMIAAAIGGVDILTGATSLSKQTPTLSMTERAMGRIMNRGELNLMISQANKSMISAQSMISTIETYRRTAGTMGLPRRKRKGGGTMIQWGEFMEDITGFVEEGVAPEQAAEFLARGKRFGGGIGVERLERRAVRGGYGTRMPEFLQAVNRLTGSMQDMGATVGTDVTSALLASVGELGERFVGPVGEAVTKSLMAGGVSAQALQTPADALVFRALSEGGKYGYEATMRRMEKIGPREQELIREEIRRTTSDPVARADLIKSMPKIFGLSLFSAAYDYISAERNRGARDVREDIGDTFVRGIAETEVSPMQLKKTLIGRAKKAFRDVLMPTPGELDKVGEKARKSFEKKTAKEYGLTLEEYRAYAENPELWNIRQIKEKEKMTNIINFNVNQGTQTAEVDIIEESPGK